MKFGFGPFYRGGLCVLKSSLFENTFICLVRFSSSVVIEGSLLYLLIVCTQTTLHTSIFAVQMFEHSQAIHAHQRQAQVTTSAQGNQPSMSQPSTQRQNSRGAITQDLLTSALAGAMSGSPQPSPLSSLDISNRWLFKLCSEVNK